jgi:hypothetical protein
MDHQHNLKAHRKVVSVLDEISRKKIIKQMGLTASEVKEEFRCGDVVLTVMFWGLLWNDPEFKHIETVDYCRGCKKFMLDMNKQL